MSNTAHPAWLAIGARVEIVRRIGQSVSWRALGTVVRHTATMVEVENDRGGKSKFRSTRYGYHASPAYLDYITELRQVEEADQ